MSRRAGRIIFMGSPAFAVPSLTALCERPDLARVTLVVTQPDKPAGRGRKLTPCPVKLAAQARGIPTFEPTRMKAPETRAALAAQEPDAIIVAAYGRILPAELLALPASGCINVHASLLPRHRGASPIAHAILDGDPETGVCIMGMEAGLDTGPVYARTHVAISPLDTCGSLTVTLAQKGAILLLDTLAAILDGEIVPVPQDEARATYAPLLDKDHGRIDFAAAAELVARRVRAYSPWPTAFTFRGDQRVAVLAAAAETQPGDPSPPGTVINTDRGVVVQCGVGVVRLLEVKPAGKQAMATTAWVQGRGIALGDQLT